MCPTHRIRPSLGIQVPDPCMYMHACMHTRADRHVYTERVEEHNWIDDPDTHTHTEDEYEHIENTE